MNFLRHNIVTLALVLIVAGVTALNSYTLKAGLSQFHMNNADLVAEVAFSAQNRCDRLESTLNRLYQDYLAMRKEAASLANEVRECHDLLEQAGIPKPGQEILPNKEA
jgi:hypothetical protein